MPLPKPNLDEYTEKINNIIPTKTLELPTTVKTSVIGDTISNVKGELKDKVCGAVDLVSDIKSGLSSLATDVKDIDVGAYINSGVDAVKGKLNEAKNLFASASAELQKGAASIKDEIKNSLNALEDEIVQQVESAKLAAAGLKDTVKDIGNMGNKLVKNLTTLPDFKGNFCDEKTAEAAEGVEAAAQAEIPVAEVTKSQTKSLSRVSSLAGPMTEEEEAAYFAGQAIIPTRFIATIMKIDDYYDFSPYEMSDYFAIQEFAKKEAAAGYPEWVADNGTYITTYFEQKAYYMDLAKSRLPNPSTVSAITLLAKQIFEERFGNITDRQWI
jgi:hypothetical protein